MLLNSSITLDIIFQQCYDNTNLNPNGNNKACLECFQGIYAGENYQPNIEQLAHTIFQVWGKDMHGESFTQALTFFKKRDGSQAFHANDIAAQTTKYYCISRRFRHDGSLSCNNSRNFTDTVIGDIGVSGTLNKVIIVSTLLESVGILGSEFKITLMRNNRSYMEFHFFNQNYNARQTLTNVETTDGLPISVLSTDKIILGAYRVYTNHVTTISNTVFEFVFTPEKQ